MELKITTRKVLVNSLIQIGGKVVTTILSLILTAVIARSLGVFGYGEFTTAFAFMTFFGVIADFGFFQILVRELARHPGDEQRVASNVMTMRTLFALVVYLIAALLVWIFPYSMAVKLGVAILAGASFFLSINTTLVGIFQAHHRMDRAVIGDVIGRIILLFTVLSALHAQWSLPAILSLYLVANLINLIISFLFLRRFVELAPRYQPKEWRDLFLETWPMALVTMLGVLYFKIDIIILSIFKTSTEVGIYGAPYKILEVLTLIPGIFMGNVLPALTRLSRDDSHDLRRMIQVSFDILTVLMVGTVIGLVTLAHGAIGLVAGGEFIQASTFSLHLAGATIPITPVQMLQLLAVALSLIFLSNLWATLLIALGHQRALIRPNLIAVVLNLSLNLFFIPRGSYFAAALTTIVTEAYILWSLHHLADRYVPMRISYARFGKALIAGALMALVLWTLRSLPVIIPLLAGASVYIALLALLKAFPEHTWQRIWRKQ